MENSSTNAAGSESVANAVSSESVGGKFESTPEVAATETEAASGEVGEAEMEVKETEESGDGGYDVNLRRIQYLQAAPEVAELIQGYSNFEQQIVNTMMRDDFAVIKEAYPDIIEKSVADFGDEFFRLIALGYEPIIAYEAVRAKILRETKNPPPTIGAVNNTSGDEKDYYSPEEADKLTREDFRKNPRLLEVVRKSMLKWNS